MTFNYGPTNTKFDNLIPEFQIEGDEQFVRQLIANRERQTAYILNVKETAIYETTEILTSQQWFGTSTAGSIYNARYTFRLVVNFGALPNNSAKSVAHGLVLDDGVNPSQWFFTKIYATAFDPTQGNEKIISLPYYDIAAGAVSNPIGIFADGTNVTITTTSNRTNFTQCYVVLEYLKQI